MVEDVERKGNVATESRGGTSPNRLRSFRSRTECAEEQKATFTMMKESCGGRAIYTIESQSWLPAQSQDRRRDKQPAPSLCHLGKSPPSPWLNSNCADSAAFRQIVAPNKLMLGHHPIPERGRSVTSDLHVRPAHAFEGRSGPSHGTQILGASGRRNWGYLDWWHTLFSSDVGKDAHGMREISTKDVVAHRRKRSTSTLKM